jgi:hypothetical protein
VDGTVEASGEGGAPAPCGSGGVDTPRVPAGGMGDDGGTDLSEALSRFDDAGAPPP